MSFQIAIDGPVAAGKGTVSRLVAERLGMDYIDTGAMYRTTAYMALQHHVPYEDEAKLVELINHSEMDVRTPTEEERDGRLATVTLDGEDISWKIRTEEVSQGSSKVSTLPKVRKALVAKQQQIAQNKDVVMEGRDITYRVLPDADLKIYLTASDTVRAKRRHQQLLTKGEDVTFAEVYQDLLERDQRDMTRSADPLQITDDAWVVDSSDLSIENVVQTIVNKAQLMRHG